MKNTIILLAVFAAFSTAQGQSCCTKNTDQSFPQLAMSDGFAAAHLEPLPFTDEKPNGKNIILDIKGQNPGKAYVIMSEAPTKNWIFVYHEWWGLNDYIRKEADKLQTSLGNVNVIAIDLFDGKVADDAKAAQELSSNLNDARARSIIKSALNYVGNDMRIVSLGWCFGGGWSLQSALLEGQSAVGCVMYYGVPENDVNKLKTLKCDILGIFATNDDFIDKNMVSKFQTNLETAGVKNTIQFYEANHAFANPSNPKHDVEATRSAYDLVLTYLKEKFAN